MTSSPIRRAPPLSPEQAAFTEEWFEILKQEDPEEGQRVLWQAFHLVSDVSGAPREAIADAHAEPASSGLDERLRDWLCYALHLIRECLPESRVRA